MNEIIINGHSTPEQKKQAYQTSVDLIRDYSFVYHAYSSETMEEFKEPWMLSDFMDQRIDYAHPLDIWKVLKKTGLNERFNRLSNFKIGLTQDSESIQNQKQIWWFLRELNNRFKESKILN